MYLHMHEQFVWHIAEIEQQSGQRGLAEHNKPNLNNEF